MLTRADFLSRLKALLPPWFGDKTPTLDGVLSGYARVCEIAWGWLNYALAQTRIKTATTFNLDLIAWDYFGARFQRKPSQNDDSLRQGIITEILRPRATRPGMATALHNLTGVEPIIFEPWNPNDTGVWGRMMAYSVHGRYGSLQHHHECWIDVQRPLGQGIPGVEGYGGLAGAYAAGMAVLQSGQAIFSRAGAALVTRDGSPITERILTISGTGRAEYVSLNMVSGPVTDLDIYRTVDNTRAAGTVCWVRISDALPPIDLQPSYSFLTDENDQRLVLDDESAIILDGPPLI